MYPINAASPQRLAIGPVVQISDGAVQTSGVSVKVLPQGTTASAGGGTIAYEEGIVHYLPTQAETNYASFIVIAYKTGCIPACITVVTSASSTAGYAGTDQSKIANATSTVNLSGTTIKTATDVETDTADIQTRLPAALVSGRIDASVGAMAADVLTSTALAASAVTEIQSGLSTLDAAGVRTAVGLASANLDTQLGDIPTVSEFNARTIASADYATATNLATVDTVADAIKAKTDSLTFTVAGQVDANIQYVNDVQVIGTGAPGDEWGP